MTLPSRVTMASPPLMVVIKMPTFRAINKVDLLLPGSLGVVYKIRKLKELPDDYEDLEYLHERTDLTKATGHLEIQDKVILVIDRAGWQDIYEVCCVRGVGR